MNNIINMNKIIRCHICDKRLWCGNFNRCQIDSWSWIDNNKTNDDYKNTLDACKNCILKPPHLNKTSEIHDYVECKCFWTNMRNIENNGKRFLDLTNKYNLLKMKEYYE